MLIYALKLLMAVLVVSGTAFYVFRSAFNDLLSTAEYKRIWMILLAGVVAAYLSLNPVIFLFVFSIIAIQGAAATGRGPAGKIAIYLLFACTMPPIRFMVGGFGGITYGLELQSVRLAAIVLLGWAAIECMGMKPQPRSIRFICTDLLVIAYPVLRLILIAPHSTFTTLARTTVEWILDILLPYFVVTRGLRSMSDLRFALVHLLIGLIFVASVGVAEIVVQYKLVAALQWVYAEKWQLTYMLMRGGLIRVQSTMPQPIILAFIMLFGLGLAYWLKGRQWRRPVVAAIFAAMLLTLVATFSRGPWLAAGAMAMLLLGMRRLPPGVFRMLLIAVVVAGVGLKLANADDAVMTALGALFGSSETDLSTIQYRKELLDTSLALIKQSPWIGVPNYSAEMQSLRQGEGIIDIVNTYIAVLLDAGVVGLTIYLMPYLITVNRLISAARRTDDGKFNESNRFAVAFVAIIGGSLFAILTTSNWGVMPLLLTLEIALPTVWLGLSVEERNRPAAVSPDAARGVPRYVQPPLGAR